MARFSLSLLFATAASVSAYRGQGSKFRNYRSGEDYTTRTTNKSSLTLPGVEVFISPKDSFDFVPATGYAVNGVELIEKQIAANGGVEATKETAAIVKNDDIAEWAMSRLHSEVQKHQPPRPNESLAGKVLTVKASEEILTPEDLGSVVVCHAFDQESSFCHKLHSQLGVTKITVEPNGKPSELWVACHYSEEEGTSCHVLNVGDAFFSTGTADVSSMLRGKN